MDLLRNMMFMKKKENVLEKEPYATFLREFSKLNGITNEKIHMCITSDKKRSSDNFAGFSLDYVYTKRFDLDFQFVTLIDEERIQHQKFCILHTISYRFDDEDYQFMMMDTIDDIKKRNGYIYISSDVIECEVDCGISNKNLVTVSFCIFCNKEKVKEVCLQLISQDIILFARSF